MVPSSSRKRAREAADDAQQSSQKARKVHPFFQKHLAEDDSGVDKPFRWLPPLGPTGSCLHAVNQAPASTPKVAALDLDGTLIKADLRHTTDWQWWSPVVPKKLRELHEQGYSIVIISNQNLKATPLKTWKEKVALIARALEPVPFRLFAATVKDQYRKPMPGMWDELERLYAQDGVQIDKEESFFIGDAAGRIYSKTKKDFASTDRKWALNLNIQFLTPEEYFLGLAPHDNVELPGFNVSSLPDYPPSHELVLFVGSPCLGKTTFYTQNFKNAGYTHVNQDTLKTRPKCIAAVQEAVKNGHSCVIDNTNRNAATRKFYIDVAKKHNLPIRYGPSVFPCQTTDTPSRCFYFTGSTELAWHNNLYRAFIKPVEGTRRDLLPFTAFIGFKDGFEEPQLNEGFAEIRRVNWVFEGTEEERKRWSMWLQISGK
ncbi:hypothetical protein MD484_g4408, partial [Candolleomyces efflorescens]